MSKEKIQDLNSEQTLETSLRELVVHNDDFNTFDFVIKTLIEVCDHDPIQAEQCTYIIHYRGRCPVSSGDYYKLEPKYREILNRGITATIE